VHALWKSDLGRMRQAYRAGAGRSAATAAVHVPPAKESDRPDLQR